MILCDYGCGNEAKYKFKNGKWCCSENYRQCEIYRSKQRGEKNPFYNKHHNEKTKEKLREFRKKQKCPRTGKYHSSEAKKRMSLSHTGKKLKSETKEKIRAYNRRTIKVLNKKYPLFSKIEEMRYNPNKPEEKEIQVHCKNHLCPNSKEQGGWFTPTSRQIECRIFSIETKGDDLSYFYCSDVCKNNCPLFRLNPNFELNSSENLFLESEFKTFKDHILNIDNNKCQICEVNKNLHVHHIIPKKLEPYFSLDPENGICLCNKCHYKYGHKDECSTGRLANKICK